MKYKELNGLGETEFIEKDKKLKEYLHKLNYERSAGRVEKPHLFSQIKKDIARIKTALNGLKKDKKK